MKGCENMAVDGYLNFDTKLDTSGFNGGLAQVNTTVTKSIEKVKNQLKTFAKTAAVAFSTYAITNFGKECIELGSDLAEVQNVVDVTFPAMTKQVDKWAKSAANSFGLSETMAKRYVGTFGSMAEAFGFTEKEAYDMSTTLTGLAGDVASFYNIRQDEAYTKLKSVFSGETETLKDLGIVMTQTALDSYALANGYGKTTAKMTEAEKVTLRYKFVQDQLANATGDFARTQDSWANQTRILQLRLDSLKATLGQGLINVFSPLLKNLNFFIEKLDVATEKFKSFTEQVFGYSSATDNSANSASSEMTDLADETKSANSALATTSKKTKEIKDNLQGFDRLNVMSLDNSSSDDSTAVNSPTKKSSKAAVNALDTAATAIEKRTNKVFDSIKRALNNLKNAFASIGESWKRVWKNGTGERIIGNIKQLLKNVFDIIGDISGAFTKAWNKARLGDEVVQSIIDKWNSLLELVNTIAEDFRKVWNNGTGVRIWTNILNIIKNCNNYTKTLRTKVKQAWDKNESGKKIWEAILGIVEDITGFLSDMSEIRLEWLESLDLSPLVSAVADLGQAFRDLLKACGDKLKQAYKNILLPLAKWTIEEAVPKLVEALAGALKLLSKIVKSISDKTLYAIAGGITAVGTAVVVFKAGQAIASGIDKVKNAIKLFLTTVSANPILAVAGAITGLVTAVTVYNQLVWSNSEAKKFADEIDGIKSRLDTTTQGIEDNLSDTLERMDSLYADNTLVDSYQQKLDELLQKATLSPEEQAQLETIVTYFKNNVDGFSNIWNNYVSISSDGKLHLNGDLSEVRNAIDNTIDKYQQLANSAALAELSSENSKERILASKEYNSAKSDYNSKKKDLENEQKKLKKWLEKNGKSMQALENYYFGGGAKNDALWKEGIEYFENIQSKTKSLEGATSSVNKTIAALNKLTMTSDDLLDVQKVVKGEYSDAAAVLMAYNAGMINTEQIQKSQWKSLNNLQKAAKDTGKNTVLGLVEGTEAYEGALVKNSHGLASTVLSEYDTTMGIHSPSTEMYERGGYTVQGLANGIRDRIYALKNPLARLLSFISTHINPISSVFSNAFEGIKSAVKKPMNGFLGVVQNFLNNFIDPFNSLGSAISGGMSTAAKIAYEALGSVNGNVGLPNITVPRLATGTVVPANYGEFLAVLGDNKREAEVVSPISTIKQALIEAMAEIGSTGDSGDINLTVNLDGEVIFNNIVKRNNAVKKRHGVGALG
jgi:phage-related protein